QQDNSEMDDSRRQELLEEALTKLPDKQRIPLTLYHFEDMSYDEIAAQLGVSLGKIKTDIHRARESLKKTLRFDHEGDIVRSNYDQMKSPKE
ncbi:MAG: RNA polymerase sigma factor, partial [Limisphaerales bacterium]